VASPHYLSPPDRRWQPPVYRFRLVRPKRPPGGGRTGRAAGSRNKATLAIERLLNGEAKAITRKAIELAKEGDQTALRLCLDRIYPPRKDRPIMFALPDMQSGSDTVRAVSAIVGAVASGRLTPMEAGELAKVVEAFAKAALATDLEERVRRLEAAK
jgi:hypothetical protein